jgi:hypothetical protein
MSRKTKAKKNKKKKHKKIMKLKSTDNGEPDADMHHKSYGSLQESDRTYSSRRLAFEDSLPSIPDASLPFDSFAGEHAN